MANVLIGIILVVRAILKDKISARWYYAMWFLLIIKLIIQSLFKTPFNLIYLFKLAISKLSVDQGVGGSFNF